jgi:hypothetical protein
MRKFLSLIGASLVVLVASGATAFEPGTLITLEDVDGTTVIGKTNNGVSLAAKGVPGTVFRKGFVGDVGPSPGLPPNPCNRAVLQWNRMIDQGRASNMALYQQLNRMAHMGCRARVLVTEEAPAADGNGVLQSIQPVAD